MPEEQTMVRGRYSGILVELARGARRAPLTALLCLACLVVTLGSWLDGGADPESWEHLARWGALSGADIWEGKVWGLLTSVFVHGDVLHLAFNVYWLWTFGLVLERALPRVALLGLFVAAGVVTSAAELAVTGEPGIGASGVGYAWFGVLWSARRAVPAFEAALDLSTIRLFLVWLVVCFVATQLEVWNIGNAAHLGGLLFGVGVGRSFVPGPRRAIARAATVLASAGVLVASFWCPWNADWTFQRGLRQHARGELDQAHHSYRRSLALGVEPALAWNCLAYLALAAGDLELYQEALGRLREIDAQEARSLAEFARWRSRLKVALELQTDSLERELGSARLAAADWNEGRALDTYRRLLREHPDDARVQTAFASFLVLEADAPSRAELRLALDLARSAAAATRRQEVETLEALAEALFRNGDPRAAHEVAQETMALWEERGESIPPEFREQAARYRVARE